VTDLLALGAHPDDVELCCGGWLALAARRGQGVRIVDLTAGELATNGNPELRAAEAAEAAEVLGVAGRENLGLPDGGLSPHDEAQVAAVVEVIRRHRPVVLLAPWAVARHPDHAAASALIARAVFFAGLPKVPGGAPHRPLRVLAYPERHDAPADLVVDVTEVAAIKAAAIGCHRSQLAGAPTVLTSGLGLGAFTVRDRYWGGSIGVEHGEPYVVGGPLPVSDPIAHFLAHPARPVWVPR
jgi:N-acetylglucosamine malate deacetylase 1